MRTKTQNDRCVFHPSLCHKKLHHADLKTEFLDPGWKIVLEGKEHIIQ